MWKNHKKLIILTSLLTLLPIAAGLLLWNKLPAQIAIHFAADGTLTRCQCIENLCQKHGMARQRTVQAFIVLCHRQR